MLRRGWSTHGPARRGGGLEGEAAEWVKVSGVRFSLFNHGIVTAKVCHGASLGNDIVNFRDRGFVVY